MTHAGSWATAGILVPTVRKGRWWNVVQSAGRHSTVAAGIRNTISLRGISRCPKNARVRIELPGREVAEGGAGGAMSERGVQI